MIRYYIPVVILYSHFIVHHHLGGGARLQKYTFYESEEWGVAFSM